MNDLIILGASARAAAFSALRAGIRPWCADLFADADLIELCPTVRLTGAFPHGFAALLETAPAVPWIYTGGLEHYPRLVSRLSKMRPLWGNDATALKMARNPAHVAHLLLAAGLSVPRLGNDHDATDDETRWLLKPLRGAGIRFASAAARKSSRDRFYLQEYIQGESWSAIYVAGPEKTRLLGVTRQLVGEPWLNAAPFQYCGSIGPLNISPATCDALERIGAVLAAGCGLRGLFGVDGIWRDDTFWPVEVNPRYTASIEVLEYATGLCAMAWHRRAFDLMAPLPSEPSRNPRGVIGKAVLFARETFRFPERGKWSDAAQEPLPQFADLPHPGERIQAGSPVMTVFARAVDVDSCLERLRAKAATLAAGLFG